MVARVVWGFSETAMRIALLRSLDAAGPRGDAAGCDTYP